MADFEQFGKDGLVIAATTYIVSYSLYIVDSICRRASLQLGRVVTSVLHTLVKLITMLKQPNWGNL